MRDVSHNASGPKGTFTVADLRQFLASADTLQLPDETPVLCTAQQRYPNNVFNLSTESWLLQYRTSLKRGKTA